MNFRLVGSRVKSIARYPIPDYDRVALYSQAATIVAGMAILWLLWPWVPTLAIGFLGVVAAIVAVRGDSLIAPEKIVWIIIAFALFVIETRSVLKDREEFAARQYQLDIQADSARTEEHKAFAEVLRNNKEHFGNENLRFDTLLSRQEALFKRQEELAQSLSGTLLPGHEAGTHFCPNVPKGAIVLLYGANGSIIREVSTVHRVLFSAEFGQVIGVKRAIDGSITVFLDIKDSNRKIIARLDQDGFVVNRNNFLEMRRDKSHLKIIDEFGNDVLDVDYMNRETIRIDATITLPNRAPFRLGHGQFEGFCTDTNGRAFTDAGMP